MHYVVTLDGAQIADITGHRDAHTGTDRRRPAHLAGDGRQPGRADHARPGSDRVRRHPPAARLVRGHRPAHGRIDCPHRCQRHRLAPAADPAQASGITTIQVKWGDGAKYFIKTGKFHVYNRRRTYTVTVIAKDRAGNRTVLTRQVTIKAKPKPKPKKKRKKGKPAPKHVARRALWSTIGTPAVWSAR